MITPIFYPCQVKYDSFPISRIKDLCDTVSMLTHDTIWLAIDRLAQSCGYSTSGLAKKAGLDPTSFNRSKRISADGKPRWPSTESVSRILDATGSTLAEFIALIANPAIPPKQQSRIPVLNVLDAGRHESFDETGNPMGEGWEHIHFPHAPDDDLDIYALEISGTDFLPLFREGDRLIIAPKAPIRRGDRIVLKTAAGALIIKELNRQTASKIEVLSFNSKDPVTSFAPKDIIWMARIVWVSQ
jgi:phage repressor protein C with HTH and peptisase S24 domain